MTVVGKVEKIADLNKEAAWAFGIIAFVFGIIVLSYWLMVEWPSQERAKIRAAQEQDRLADEIDVVEYKMVWSWQEHKSDVPGVKEAIKNAMQDEKITRSEWDQIGDKIKEYKEIKEKYEVIQLLKNASPQ